MASLDSLPSDQRAVLELVLRQGRGYDEIARLLGIDRAAVRGRALAALDTLSPSATALEPEQRGLIADYLLGQLPARVTEYAEERLTASDSERAWAQTIAAELAPVARQPLPPIPIGRQPPPRVRSAGDGVRSPSVARTAAPHGNGSGDLAKAAGYVEGDDDRPAPPADNGRHPGLVAGARPVSRRGGAVVLVIGGLAAIGLIVLVILLLSDGGADKTASSPPSSAVSASSGGGAPVPSSTAPSSGATSTSPAPTGASSAAASTTTALPSGTPVARLTLKPPAGSSKAKGVAGIYRNGAIVLVAAGVPPPTSHQAYTVWLSNSASDSEFLGWVVQGVSRSGALLTRGTLPANAGHYQRLLVALQPITTHDPRSPGRLILSSAFAAP